MRCFFLHAGEKEIERFCSRLDFSYGRKLPARETYDAVIRYGTLAPEPAEPVVLGRLAPILRAMKPRLANDLLMQCGMKTGGKLAGAMRQLEEEQRWDSSRVVMGSTWVGDLLEKQARESDHLREFMVGDSRESKLEKQANESIPVYEYEVPVFNLEVLAVYEKKLGMPSPGILVPLKEVGFKEMDLEEGHFHSKRAIREALRAVYALGLDYALVRLEVGSKGDTRVIEVDPCPNLFAAWSDKLVEAMNRFAQTEWPESPSLLLGADPEFILVKPDGRVVPASKFMDREGKVGCDAVVLSGHRVILPLAELRPDPSPTPTGLVRNLRRAMLAAAEKVPSAELAWLSGGMPVNGLPLGGHIHFSGVPCTGQLLRALDNYAALPLMIAEGEGSRRRRPRYGRLGDCRRKRHGGFEYRSLPSWLATPELAAGVLALARVIALHWRDLRDDPLQHSGLRRLFYRGEPTRLRPVARRLWAELETLAAYKEYSADLDSLKGVIFSDSPLDWSADFRVTWGIGPSVYARVNERKQEELAAVTNQVLMYI